MQIFLRQDIPHRVELIEAIRALDFNELDGSSLIYRNRRNALYMFDLPCHDGSLVLKRSRPSPHYKPYRVFEFYLRNFFKHYGRRGYRGALLFEERELPAIRPIAYWKHRVSWLRYEGCLLYEKLPADFSVREFMEKCYDPDSDRDRALLPILFRRMTELAGKIHSNGIVHGDLVTSNFLVKLDECREIQGHPGVPEFTLTLIDTDHVSRNRMPGKFLKTCLAMHCFRRVNLDPPTRKLLLKCYFGKDYRPFWYRVTQFWRWHDSRPLSRAFKDLLKARRPRLGLLPERELPKLLVRSQSDLRELLEGLPAVSADTTEDAR